MTTLDKRIESLEKQQSSDLPQCCTVFVGPDEDADQNQSQAVAAFIAEHGHHPTVMSTVQFVKPTRRDDE